jgi:5'-nucleotidase
MHILLSNDDGIQAPGLAALYRAVADMGTISVVAPDSPQSAAGHSITLKHPLAVRRVRLEGVAAQACSVSGRPADCVRLAIRKLLEERPDIVLSGINAGTNVGINVLYSGTVAAAAEGAMLGIPSVAFSAALDGGVDYDHVGRLCRRVLQRLLEGPMRVGDLINVNVPSLAGGEPLGVKVVKQSTAGLTDSYIRHGDDPDAEAYRLSDEYEHIHQERTDVSALLEGHITVTPLHVDMTNHQRLAELQNLRWTDAQR